MKRSKLLGIQIVGVALSMADPEMLRATMAAVESRPHLPIVGMGNPRPKPIGLRERIREATTIQEVETLRAEGLQYTDASQKTRRAWQTTAKRKLAELALKGVAA